MYKRILVPLDGSPTSQRGLQEAIGLAKLTGATLCLMHVVEFVPMMIDMADAATWQAIRDGLQEQGRALLAQAHEQATAAGVDSEARLEDAAGRVCDVIVAQAQAQHCDLVVMGTHGRRGWRHAMLGSDAERTVRLSPVPVLMVRAPEGG